MDFQMKSEVPIWQYGDRKEEDEMMKRTRDEDEENMNRTTKTKIKGISSSKKQRPTKDAVRSPSGPQPDHPQHPSL